MWKQLRNLLRVEGPLAGDCFGCHYAGQGVEKVPCCTCLRNETFSDEFFPEVLLPQKQEDNSFSL